MSNLATTPWDNPICEFCGHDGWNGEAHECAGPEDGGVQESTPWDEEPEGIVVQAYTCLTRSEMVLVIESLIAERTRRYGNIDPTLAPPADDGYFDFSELISRLIHESITANWFVID